MATRAATAKIMAHRGGRGGPPNTLEAIRHAIEVGAASIELDLNQTSDGVLVANHDAALDDGRWITDVTMDDLLALDRAEWDRRRALDIIAATLDTGTELYLDLKAVQPSGLRQVADTWPAEIADRSIIFAAARTDLVAWVGEHIPAGATSFLYYDPQLDLRSLAAFSRPTFVHPCFDHRRDAMAWVRHGYVERTRSLGFDLVSWSENDPEVVAELTQLGFDYVCTDEPALAVRAGGRA